MKKGSEPKFPVPGRIIYTGPEGGTYTVVPTSGNKEYFGNNKRKY